MNIRKSKIISFRNNINYFINLYKRKIITLKVFVSITNIVFPSIALFLVVISTLNIAGTGYETAIKGSDYIILSALISGIVALLNSLISFFLLKEKINYYNGIYYKLIIEDQKYKLSYEKYFDLEDQKSKDKIFENQIFLIVTGYTDMNQKDK